MRIAIHQPRVSYYTGGGEVVPLEQAKRIAHAHEVTILTSNRPKSDLFLKFLAEDNNVNVRYFEVPAEIYAMPAGHSQLRWDMESLAFGALTEGFYNSNEFDLVVTHYSTDGIAFPKGCRNILHLHGFPDYYSEFCARNLQIPAGFVSVADFVTRGWQRLYQIKDVITCHNGIDESHFVPTYAKPEFDIGYIGRLIEIKGLEYLIMAASRIKKTKPDIKIVIAGKGPDEPRLKMLACEFGVWENIDFIGYLPEDKKVEFYNAGKVFCFPSFAREGVLTTMLEAASCAKAVVTSNCCGMVEFLQHGINGLMAEPKDADHLATQLSRLLFDDEYRFRIEGNARASIEESWTWDQKIEELVESYEMILVGL